MSKFNSKTKSTTKTQNLAGGQAYKLNPKLELMHATLTTFLEDKFYESGKDRVARLEELVSRVDPEFVAKLAVVGRKEFHLRSVAHLLLGRLALIHSGDDLVKRAVVKFAERPDDLTEFASYVLDNSDDGVLTKQAKRGIRNALLKFDGYQLAKYRGEGKAVSLVDLFNLVHPKVQFASQANFDAQTKLLEGALTTAGKTWESKISQSESTEEAKANWEEMVLDGSIGYMALLRNLNNLIKHNVSDKVIDKAAEILRDPERVKKSKQLPFRFYTAYQNVKGNRVLSDALSEALDISVANAPTFDGKTLIAVDSSGSMGRAGYGAIVDASLLAAALLKNNPGADVILYDTKVKNFNGSGRTPVLDLMDRIMNQTMGGATNTSLVFDYARAANDKYDRIIILSDNQSWVEGWGYRSRTCQDALLEYIKSSGADPYVFAVDIQGYGTTDISHPKAFHISGWSDRILDFIGQMEKSESLVNYVESYKL